MANAAKILLAIIILLLTCLLFRCSPPTELKGEIKMRMDKTCLRTGVYYEGRLIEYFYDCHVDSITIVRRQAQGIQAIKDHEKILQLIKELN